MEKKTVCKLIAAIVGGVILTALLSILGLVIFMGYGGNRCDQPPAMTCDCFCCDMFGSRGYEACGGFGFWLGLGLGAAASVVLIVFVVRAAKASAHRKH